MARKRPDAPGEGAESTAKKKYSVLIDDDLVRKIKILAAAEDVSAPDWVNNNLRRLIKQQWRSTIDELDSE